MIAIVNWQYIILNGSSANGYRVKRRAGGVPPPVSNSGVDTVSSDFWNSNPAPPTIPYAGQNYVFAFWSITAVDILSPQREAHLEFGRTASSSHPGPSNLGGGSWVVTAKAYYVWDFGSGNGDNAVLIDAFDIQAGDFIPDDFVDVTPDDQSRTLTTNANGGYIDTSTQIAPGAAIKITARDFLPSSKQFGYWQDVPSLLFSFNPGSPPTVGTPDVHDIIAHNSDIVVAFAFYNEVNQPIRIPRQYEIYNPWWWLETHWGTTPPLPDPEPWLPQFAAALALANAATKVAPRLRAKVLEIALQQLSVASATIKKEIKTQGK